MACSLTSVARGAGLIPHVGLEEPQVRVDRPGDLGEQVGRVASSAWSGSSIFSRTALA